MSAGRGRSAGTVCSSISMIDGVFAPARFLDLIRNFVLFEESTGKVVKVLAKYHQVAAVHAAVESVAAAMGGDRRGGVVWHTQGAGKSYTMVFFANKLRRDPRFDGNLDHRGGDRPNGPGRLLRHRSAARTRSRGNACARGRVSSRVRRRSPAGHGLPARAAERARRRDRVHDDPEVRAAEGRADAGALAARATSS